MAMPSKPVELSALTVLRIRGPDAVRFLQGQLSNDLERLQRERALTAGLHNPQGRVIAVLRLAQLAPGDLIAVLPRELVRTVSARLQKFVLRAKVTLADETESWRVLGVRGTADLESGIALPLTPTRALLVVASALPVATDAAPEALRAWRLEDIGAGLPQVYAATSEGFLAQMLNLDLIDGVSFDKGCYTGQEVIARAHYRGRVKRRLQRFVTRAPAELEPGDSGQLTDGRAFKVVEAGLRADGRCEFLAVAPLIAGEASEAEVPAAPAALLEAEALPLPYALP